LLERTIVCMDILTESDHNAHRRFTEIISEGELYFLFDELFEEQQLDLVKLDTMVSKFERLFSIHSYKFFNETLERLRKQIYVAWLQFIHSVDILRRLRNSSESKVLQIILDEELVPESKKITGKKKRLLEAVDSVFDTGKNLNEILENYHTEYRKYCEDSNNNDILKFEGKSFIFNGKHLCKFTSADKRRLLTVMWEYRRSVKENKSGSLHSVDELFKAANIKISKNQLIKNTFDRLKGIVPIKLYKEPLHGKSYYRIDVLEKPHGKWKV